MNSVYSNMLEVAIIVMRLNIDQKADSLYSVGRAIVQFIQKMANHYLHYVVY